MRSASFAPEPIAEGRFAYGGEYDVLWAVFDRDAVVDYDRQMGGHGVDLAALTSWEGQGYGRSKVTWGRDILTVEQRAEPHDEY